MTQASEPRPDLSDEASAVVREEEALLARVSEAIAAHARRRAGISSASADATDREALIALRDEAATAREEDLPGLLLEMDVRQRLRRRRRQPLPDASSPYIAHLRVDEGRGPEDYLLGYVTFFDPDRDVRIVDWRTAPLARIFYRYREDDPYEEQFPGRLAEGTVVARRIVVVEDGVLRRIVGDALVLERDGRGWHATERSSLALRSGGAGTAARPGILGIGRGEAGRSREADVTALLDPEQYEAIAAPADRPLLVLGSAGSGKTTVALHRLARVVATDRRYTLSRARVVVPEEGLARLSRRLLEPLGVGPGLVQTAEAWVTDLARRTLGLRTGLCLEAPPLVTALKRHPAFFRAIAARPDLADPACDVETLRRRLGAALVDRDWLAAVVAAAAGDLPTTAIDETVRHTRLQVVDPPDASLESIDAERRRAVDGLPLDEGTPDALAGTLDVEDLPVLMFALGDRRSAPSSAVSVAVLDEAEDFSLFELAALRASLGERASVTLAGDEAQQTSSSFPGWPRALEVLGLKEAATVRLPTSYRCPRPIAELARRLLGDIAPVEAVRAARDGPPIGVFRVPSEGQAQLFLSEAIRDALDREPRASIGVIAAGEASARRFHTLLADLPEARLVLDGGFSFEPGVDVTDVDGAKGLEWDYVVVPDATASVYPATNEARRRLHVAVTRASHQLWLVSGGTPSPLLAGVE